MRLFFLILTVLLSNMARAEPPCEYPDCFFGEEALKTKIFVTKKYVLEVSHLGTIDENIVLVAYRFAERDKFRKSTFQNAYFVKKAERYLLEDFPIFNNKEYPRFVSSETFEKTTEILAEFGINQKTKKMDSDKLKLRKTITSQKELKKLSRSYQKQRAIKWFDEYMEDAKKQLEETLTKVNKTCVATLKATVDRKSLNTNKILDGHYQDIQYRCVEAAEGLLEACKKSATAAEKIRSYEQVTCSFHHKKSTKLVVSTKKKVIEFQVSITAPREGPGSFVAYKEVPRAFK